MVSMIALQPGGHLCVRFKIRNDAVVFCYCSSIPNHIIIIYRDQ